MSESEMAEEREEMEMRQIRSQGAQAAQQEDHSFERDVLEYLADTDLSDQNKELLADLLTRDIVFGFLDRARHNEFDWELRILKETMRLFFPPDECLIIGEDRAAINDDPTDQATPMSQEDSVRLQSFFSILRLRLTRSRNMKQQEMLRTSIAQTEVRRGERENGGGIRGKIQNWRS